MSEASAREAAWLGWPVWGLAVACIFLSYNAAGAGGVELDGAWARWLWVPWVLLAIVGTNAIARGLDAPGFDVTDTRDWLGAAAGTGVFLLVRGTLELVPDPAGPNAANLVFTGAAALALTVLSRFRVGTRVLEGLIVGAGLVALGYGLPALAGDEVVRGLIAAFAAAGGFALAGVVGLARMPDRA